MRKRAILTAVFLPVSTASFVLLKHNNINPQSCPNPKAFFHRFETPAGQQRQEEGPKSNPLRRAGVVVLGASNNWDKDIDEKIRREAAEQSRPADTVAGVVLGGLLFGPFGALFGASVGQGIGQRYALDKARKKEMERLGLTPDMLDSAREIGEALERNMQGLSAVKESYETQKRFARRLESESEELYDKAKMALQSSDEEKARKLLLERTNVQEKLKEVLKNCATARRQVETLEQNGLVLEKRATEIDALMKRTVGAKAIENSTEMGLSLSNNDPLLNKFRDMGID